MRFRFGSLSGLHRRHARGNQTVRSRQDRGVCQRLTDQVSVIPEEVTSCNG